MSTFKVTIEQLAIHEHPNADALELAQVGLYRAVVAKGVYKSGDYAVYIPESAVLPDPLIEELNLVGKLAGKAKNRVKAVRLRGEVSQGIVCRPKVLDGGLWTDPAVGVLEGGMDFAPQLGIEKWVPEIPAHMSGEVEAAPDLMRWIDIENLQRYPDIFADGEHVVATEKIHGTCCLVTLDVATGRVWVSSKGHGGKNLALVESDTNLYWRAVHAHRLPRRLAEIADMLDDGDPEGERVRRVALFGEVFGTGVQDLHYGANAGRNETIGYRAFDLKIDRDGHEEWLGGLDFLDIVETFDVPTAPVLYEGPFRLDLLVAAASGPTLIGEFPHIREGVVIRPVEERHSEVLGGRAIAKLVSPDYLLRKGGTEYE